MRILWAAIAGAAGLAACAPEPEVSGRVIYEAYCLACHGADGRGDGPQAADLGRPVADLTQIAARAGGTFPTLDVMSTIDGYSRGRKGDLVMPEFGAALADGPTVLVDAGDGVLTPTPEWLWALAEYLRSIQDDGS